MTLEPCPCFRCCDSDCTAGLIPVEEGCYCCGFYECTQCVHWDCAVDDCIFPRTSDIFKCEENNNYE